MKKNITINLFGTLYAIDDDAYQLLERYMDGMKSYFCRQEGGDEIVDDIEHRIAELFWELKEQGCEAINIENVKDIIQKIGNPEQMSSESESDQTNSSNEKTTQFFDEQEETTGSLFDKWLKSLKGRRMFRNTNDKMLGGVLSGLTKFFGGSDPLPARLIFVLLVIFTNSRMFPFFWCWVITYLILWIIMPEAHTPEDRLRMEGHKVTPENLQAQILQEETEKQNSAAVPKQSTASGCLGTILKFCIFCFLGFWGIILCIILFALIMAAVGVIGALVGAGTLEVYGWGAGVIQFVQDNSWWASIGLVCGLIVVVIPIYAILRKIFSSNGMSGRQIITLLIIWIISTGVGCGAWVSMLANWERNSDKYAALNKDLSGPEISQPYDFKNFNQLEVSRSVDVYYTQADSFDVYIEGPSNLIEKYDIQKNGNTLSVKQGTHNIRGNRKLRLFITAPELINVEASGVCEFHADSLKMQKMELDFSGASKFDIRHLAAETVKIECSGASHGEMNMTGNKITADNSGASKLDLEVDCNILNIDNSGASKANISGKAKRKHIDTSGSAKTYTVNLEVDGEESTDEQEQQ